jgi:type I restriction enzyme, R subunit
MRDTHERKRLKGREHVLDHISSTELAVNLFHATQTIFVLVDESHRSVYGETRAKMAKVLPNACFIGFTGTPLMKAEKNTARKFGGLIEPAYTIDQAVEDKALVPLLYEGRLVLQLVDRKATYKWFAVVTKPLAEAQRADLKRKFSTAEQLNKAERKIYEAAFDISEHYSQNWQATGFKAQLAAPSKMAALKYKQFLDEFGKVTSEVVKSGKRLRPGASERWEGRTPGSHPKPPASQVRARHEPGGWEILR